MNNQTKRILLLSLLAPTGLFVGCEQDSKKKPIDNSELSKNQSNEKNLSINSSKKLQKSEEMVISILSKMLNGPNSQTKVKIEKSSNLKNDLNMDSLDLAELIMNIEDTFDIIVEVEGKEVSKILTVADVIQYVNQHTKK